MPLKQLREGHAGDRLTHLREMLGMSQADFAKAVGLKRQSNVSRLENQAKPAHATILSAAAGLTRWRNATLLWLRCETDVQPPILSLSNEGPQTALDHMEEAETNLRVAKWMYMNEKLTERQVLERGFQLGVDARHAADRTNPTPSTTEGAKLLEAPGGPQTDPEPSPLLPAATPPQSEDEDRTA